MMLKTDALGWCLNAQVLLAGLAIFLPKRVAQWVWTAVLPVAVTAIALRWHAVAHPPMKNLFEAFLWLPPLLVLGTWWTWWRDRVCFVRADAILGFILAFPLAFVFSAQVTPLPPALQSPYFVPHVLGYMIAYALLARAFTLECKHHTRAADRNVAWGFFLLTTALALGSLWGNAVWGAYWQWDPKEQWSLATWLIYAAFFHVRGRPRWRLALLGVGLLAILLTVTWINLSKLFPGMHSYA